VAQIGKGEHRHGSVFRPRRGVLPDPNLFDSLRLSFITATVALLQFQQVQAFQMFVERLADQSRSVNLLPLGCHIGGFQESCVKNHLYAFAPHFN